MTYMRTRQKHTNHTILMSQNIMTALHVCLLHAAKNSFDCWTKNIRPHKVACSAPKGLNQILLAGIFKAEIQQIRLAPGHLTFVQCDEHLLRGLEVILPSSKSVPKCCSKKKMLSFGNTVFIYQSTSNFANLKLRAVGQS